jgi:hypothetical protein
MQAEFSARSGIFLCLVISRVELIRKDKEKFHSARKIPPILENGLKAIFHCSRFARAGGATNFIHVKNQSPGHAKKVECSSTFMACPRAVRRTKNAQVRQLQRKLSNARAKRLQWKIAFQGGFPFSAKCRTIDFLRSLSFEMCMCSQLQLMRFVPLDCLYFKRKRSQKVDRATFCTEWKPLRLYACIQKAHSHSKSGGSI